MFQDCSNSAAFCALNLPFRVFTDAKGMMDAISIPRVQEPAAIRLRLRVFQTPIFLSFEKTLLSHQLQKTVWKTGS